MTLSSSSNGGIDREVRALRLVQQFQSALQKGSRADVVDNLRQLVDLCAPMAGQWLQLAPMAADFGEFDLARRAVDLYVEASGGGHEAQMAKVNLLAYIGDVEAALELLERIPHTVPDKLSYCISRGSLASIAGRLDEAREWLERAVALAAGSGRAWHLLSIVVDFAHEPALAARLTAGEIGLRSAPRVERAYYTYAVGKAHADRAEHDRAFAAFARANREVKAEFPYDVSHDRQDAACSVAGYTADRVAQIAQLQDQPTARSIFVTGLPRSGTTLVQQVLTSQSEVGEGGEVNLLRWLVREMGDASYPSLEAYVRRAGASSLAQTWTRMMGERFRRPGRIVDKTTNTTRSLGVVASILPDAPVVWLQRDKLDCAWSCFRTCFMENVRWSNDLRDIAEFFRVEDTLFQRWQAILGDRLLMVPFEGLVTDPASWISRILKHCGLADEAAAYAPHRNRQAVITASSSQIREPINRRGIGVAEPYREFLQPFVDAYQD